ncbi:hypothetical protein RN001_016181 [Aquatica leii]|uniref:Uncharacterized protein n=1 Tax=Aquatica leii TaxID=1421715 RepID=A0AAN7SB95_9COLE|nr:hypothetical protein RN001_016181 [Aquatica leii]
MCDFHSNFLSRVRPRYLVSFTQGTEQKSPIWLSEEKAEEIKLLAGFSSKYLSERTEKKDDEGNNRTVESGSSEQIIEDEAKKIGEKSAACDFNDEKIAEKEHVSDASNIEFFSKNDAADWPIPVPEHIRISIIEKGSEVYQNNERPFEAIERPGEHTKGIRRSLTSAWFYSHLNETKYLRK